MFPAPSPNTQAIFNLQSAGVTPGTADFQQSAMRAAAQHQANHNKTTTSAPTSQPEAATAGMDRQNNYQQAQQPQQRAQNDPYSNHDVSSAANDLLSFASQNGAARNNQPPYSMAPQQQSMNAGHMPVQPVNNTNNHGRRDTKGSINSVQSAETGDFSESGQSEQTKTATRSRAKKGAANGKQAAGNKRKAEDGPKNSRKKSNANQSMGDDMDDGDSDEGDIKEEEYDSKGRKMTDEEKRKNFLERNRYVHFLTPTQLHANTLKGCCTQVPSTQEAMAGQSPSQGRALQYRERRSFCYCHSASRGDCQLEDTTPCAQRVPCITSSGPTRRCYEQLPGK
jgi:ATF/CREB family transcription factor